MKMNFFNPSKKELHPLNSKAPRENRVSKASVNAYLDARMSRVEKKNFDQLIAKNEEVEKLVMKTKLERDIMRKLIPQSEMNMNRAADLLSELNEIGAQMIEDKTPGFFKRVWSALNKPIL